MQAAKPSILIIEYCFLKSSQIDRAVMSTANKFGVWLKPFSQKIWEVKNIPKLMITPTTAAVINCNGFVYLLLFWLDLTRGAPSKINKKDGKKVNQVATTAPNVPAKNGYSPFSNSLE